jgi:hypothetical protein
MPLQTEAVELLAAYFKAKSRVFIRTSSKGSMSPGFKALMPFLARHEAFNTLRALCDFRVISPSTRDPDFSWGLAA